MPTPIAPRSVAAPQTSSTSSAARSRQLPSPAPAEIKVGRLTATRVAQTADMVRYEVQLKGKPVFIDVMEKFNPRTALPAPEGFLKGRQALVLTDRDGVLNKAGSFLNKPSDVTAGAMIPAGLAGARALDDAKVGLAIVTNQGGYQIGKMSFEDTLAVNVRVAQRIAEAGGRVDAILICPFNGELKSRARNDVDARKPSPGMVTHAAKLAEAVGLKAVGMVGDQRTDGAAGQRGGLPFYAITDTTHGRWAEELASARRKNETLPPLDAGKLVETKSLAEVAKKVLAELPRGSAGRTDFTPGTRPPPATTLPGAALATGAAQTLRTTGKTSELPAAWLRGATAALQEHAAADPRGYYDHRVALHGADATRLLANFAKETNSAKPAFSAGSELLMVQVHGGDELYAELFAHDVLTGKTRPVGQLDYETLEPALQWDGLSAPKTLENAVRLPLGKNAYDWGDTLVGFDSIPKHKLTEALDFDALVKLGPSQQPALAPAMAALARAPQAVADLYQLALSGDGKSVSVSSGATRHKLEATAGAKFVEAGWSTGASIDQAIEGLASPRLERDGWIDAEDAITHSRFGSDKERPLLWLKQDDGKVRFVAFSAKADQPNLVEVAGNPLKVTGHGEPRDP